MYDFYLINDSVVEMKLNLRVSNNIYDFAIGENDIYLNYDLLEEFNKIKELPLLFKEELYIPDNKENRIILEEVLNSENFLKRVQEFFDKFNFKLKVENPLYLMDLSVVENRLNELLIYFYIDKTSFNWDKIKNMLNEIHHLENVKRSMFEIKLAFQMLSEKIVIENNFSYRSNDFLIENLSYLKEIKNARHKINFSKENVFIKEWLVKNKEDF